MCGAVSKCHLVRRDVSHEWCALTRTLRAALDFLLRNHAGKDSPSYTHSCKLVLVLILGLVLCVFARVCHEWLRFWFSKSWDFFWWILWFQRSRETFSMNGEIIINQIHILWPTWQDGVVKIYTCVLFFSPWHLMHNLILISDSRSGRYSTQIYKYRSGEIMDTEWLRKSTGVATSWLRDFLCVWILQSRASSSAQNSPRDFEKSQHKDQNPSQLLLKNSRRTLFRSLLIFESNHFVCVIFVVSALPPSRQN